MFCRSLFVLLAIVLSVPLLFMDYDYPFGILKLFLKKRQNNDQNKKDKRTNIDP